MEAEVVLDPERRDIRVTICAPAVTPEVEALAARLLAEVSGKMLGFRGAEAAPLDPAAPVPLNALFCLARPERVEGRPHLVWTFSPEGRPRLPAVGEEPPPARERKNSCIFPDEST